MTALGVARFAVRINNRKIHDGLAEALGIAARGSFSRAELIN
jgi:histidyl-tRNA synthetase